MKLEEFEKLEQAATPGPWGLDWFKDHRANRELWRAEGPIVTSREQAVADSEFVAAAREMVPRMIKALKAAKDLMSLWGDYGWPSKTCDKLRDGLAQLEQP